MGDLDQKRVSSRMASELKQLSRAPPPGVACYPRSEGSLTQLEAVLQGPQGTVYEGGCFRVCLDIPARYPFEPPAVRFITPVYHPNIDVGGRVCLDILNLKPKGAWTPALNVGTVLSGILSLLAHPNADDGLMTDITEQYKHHREAFDARAREMTHTHATGGAEPAAEAAGAAGPAEGAAAAGDARPERVGAADAAAERAEPAKEEDRRPAPEEGAEPAKKVSRS